MACNSLFLLVVLSLCSSCVPAYRLFERTGSRGYTSDEEIAILNKHNEYRAGVSPAASDMIKMTWDSTLATLAQTWTENCYYAHPNKATYREYLTLGQNLFIEYPDPTGANPPSVTKATTEWYNEVNFYTFNTDPDISNTCSSICGHYTQLVWADTEKVGCGINFCSHVTTSTAKTYSNAWMVACNYSPGGNYVGWKPYTSGGVCSSCPIGMLCKDSLCTDCTGISGCECKRVCDNCGTTTSSCGCSCPQGYFGAVCENFCVDTSLYCGANPGWPTSLCNSAGFDYVNAKCPKMCGECEEGSPVTC